ncbi:hypothetical protein POTOM_016542 [Populus tomentosa]|uniref:Transcription repressor n=1 Tax=Populus tomentosa TaxID=118781 RepID=A0A8X8D3C7_POPTO|nr:hypothetical protein POTOM_016542 [Populus tomentosa]
MEVPQNETRIQGKASFISRIAFSEATLLVLCSVDANALAMKVSAQYPRAKLARTRMYTSRMKASRVDKKQKLQQRGCKAFCCSCRLSVSSSEEAESSNPDRFASISSLAHAMVQERLDQMIRERQEARQRERRRRIRSDGTKFIVMVAMEKSSYDPREDFRESMVEMIMANRLQEPKDLRSLLNYYMSMNSEEYRGMILEVFHEMLVLLVSILGGWLLGRFSPAKKESSLMLINPFHGVDA